MFNVVCCLAWSVVYFLKVSNSSFISSVGEEKAVFFSAIDYSYFCCSSSPWMLGKGYTILLRLTMCFQYNNFNIIYGELTAYSRAPNYFVFMVILAEALAKVKRKQ